MNKISNTNEQALLREEGMDFICKCLSTDTWYDNLQKPQITPPKWLFALIWTIVYGLIGVSLYFYIKNT